MTTNKRFKRILALLLAAALCFSNMLSPALSAFAAAYTGTGTSSSNPYVLILGDNNYSSYTLSGNWDVSTKRSTNVGNNDVVSYSTSNANGGSLTITARNAGTATVAYRSSNASGSSSYSYLYFVVVNSSNVYEVPLTVNGASDSSHTTTSVTSTTVYSSSTAASNAATYTLSGDTSAISVTANLSHGDNAGSGRYYYNLTYTVTAQSAGTAYVVYTWGGNTYVYKYTVSDPTYTYTVSYDLNDEGGVTTADGDAPSDDTTTSSSANGASVTITTADPTRTGYTFEGWSTTSDGDAEYGGDTGENTIFITEDTTLYAVWSLDNYTVTFYNGSAQLQSVNNANYGDSVTNLYSVATPTEASDATSVYTFSHWSTTEGGSAVTTVTGAASYYAVYSTQAVQYSVSYKNGLAEGSTETVESMPSATTVANGSDYTIPGTPTRTGYTFQGWDSNGDGGVDHADGATFTMPTSNVTLTAVWAINTYTVTYNANDGTDASVTASDAVEWGKDTTVAENTFDYEHYNFLGWAYNADFTAAEIAAGATISSVKADVALYAVWQAKTYTITYAYGDDVIVTNESESSAQAVVYGTEGVTVSATEPKATNMQFLYWEDEATKELYGLGASITVTDDVTLIAVWAGLYNVSYDDGVAEDNASQVIAGTMPSSSGYIYQSGGTVTISSTEPEREGYTFAGWKVDDQGLTYDSTNNNLKMSEGGITLVAQWEIESYTITYYHDHAYEYDTAEGNSDGDFADLFAAYTTQQNNGPHMGGQTVEFAGDYTYTSGGANVFEEYFNTTLTVDYLGTISGIDTRTVTATADASINGSTLFSTYEFVDYTVYSATGEVLYDNVTDLSTVKVDQNLTIVSNFKATSANYEYEGYDDNTTIHMENGTTGYQGQIFTRYDVTVIDYYEVIDGTTTHYDVVGSTNENTTSVINWTLDGDSLNFTCVNAGTAYITIESYNGIETFAITVNETYDVTYALASGETYSVNDGKEISDYNLTQQHAGDTITITAADPEKVGYTFAGWQVNYTDADGNPATAEVTEGTGGANDTFTMPEADVTLTATWEKDASKWLVVTVESYDDTYDGEAHGVTVTVATEAGELPSGVDVTIDYATLLGAIFGSYNESEITRTDVTYIATGVYVKASADGYVTAYGSGSISITAADLTVTATTSDLTPADDTTDYTMTYGDATPEFTAVASGFVGEETYDFATSNDFSISGDYINVGTYSIDVTELSAWKQLANKVLCNYSITYVGATLTVEQADLTVTVADASKTYGNSDPTFSASATDLAEGDSISYSFSRASGSSVGTYAISAVATIVNEDGEDVTENYNITVVDGTLTINAAATTTTTTTTTTTVTEVATEEVAVEETPAAAAAAATATTTEETEDEEEPVEIEEDEVPLVSAEEDEVTTEIEEEEVPLVATASTTGWALLNLLLAIGTVATSIVLLVSYFLNRRDEEGEAVGNQEKMKLLSIAPAAIAAAFFMLTSDMSSGMSFVDKWTLAMALVALIQLAIVVVTGQGKKTVEGDDFH